ncbi:MAG: glycosyltransferase family 2 protein [Rhodospirillaceae bacterium]|nr:glycosyltransferase family 2 protein [Rhodospirillaceae bacterium]MBT7268139.1 glycosyltransferase family 2 protein [Rhodospirillaceae bacterium]
MTKATLSALVVVHNEEAILEDCLKRLDWVDELVVVLDKCTDGSKAISQAHNARLLEGSWEIEGPRRNDGIDFCKTDWILEVDADEWITPELASEIRKTIDAPEYDVYNLIVDNYIGDKHVVHGWGGGSFGKPSYIGLFRKGVKTWGMQRLHPHLTVTGAESPTSLQHHVVHHIYADFSEMLHRLDRYTTFRAKDLVDNNEIMSPANAFRKFLSRFYKVYFRRSAYKEGGYGFMIALCAALYPLISNIKAIYEEAPQSASAK